MPSKIIYVADDDLLTWEEAAKISKRRHHSVSSLVTMLLKDWVADNQTGIAAAMGLPTGFKPPSSMNDPVLERKIQIADDVRARVLDLLNEVGTTGTTRTTEEEL